MYVHARKHTHIHVYSYIWYIQSTQHRCRDAVWRLKIHGYPRLDRVHERLHEVQQEKGRPTRADRGRRHGHQRYRHSASSRLTPLGLMDFSICMHACWLVDIPFIGSLHHTPHSSSHTATISLEQVWCTGTDLCSLLWLSKISKPLMRSTEP